MTSTHPNDRSYRPDIDGLRGIAVLLVLVFHFRLVPGVEGGFTGVDVFFVISGFLITGIVRKSLAASTFSLRDFYVARVRRLAPALVATLAATAVAGAFILFPADLRELADQILSAQAYVANVYFWRNVNYFGLTADQVFLLHTWSLAVEEQFYLFYPLMLIVLARLRPSRFWCTVALLALASFALNLVMVRMKPEAAFYLLPTRAWELMVGALATQFDKLPTRRWQQQGSAALGLVSIAIGAVAYQHTIAFPGWFALLPTFGAALLLGSGATAPTWTHRALARQPLRYVGKISYPLYLVHWPVIVLWGFASGGPSPWAVRAALFALSVACAAVLYHLVERPVRERRVFGTAPRLLGAYGAALAASVAAFALVGATHGWPQRFPAETLRLAAFEADRSPPLTECEYAGKRPTAFEQPCVLGKPGATPEWLVIGDSHAWASHDAFDQWLAAEGVAGVFVFRHACLPVGGIRLVGDNGQCREFNEKALAFVAAHPALKSVLLVSTWRQAAEGSVSPDEHVQLDKAGSLALFKTGLGATLAQFDGLGRRVYLWEPVPGARANVPDALARASRDGRPADIEFSRADYQREFAFFFDDLRDDASHIAGTFAPSDVLCASGRCVAQKDGNPLYFDNSHLARSSAGLMAAMLERGAKPVVSAARGTRDTSR